METSETWDHPQKILGIFAHPDDPEFFCGASIARWVQQGHAVIYAILTRGDKGTRDPSLSSKELAARREQEQRSAAGTLGVTEVYFSDFEDGCLMPDMDLRREVTRIIRRIQPDILVTSDPTNFFPDLDYVNHPDHRYAGQAVLDAAFPGVSIALYFPELQNENLHPIKIKELWLTLTHQPNVTLEITEFWGVKLKALLEHRSQIGDPTMFQTEMKSWHTADSTAENPRYEESFHRFRFS